MFKRNKWYVAAWDGELDGAPFGRTICSEPIVFFRRMDGVLSALRDACPHRRLPLSMGIQEGDGIRCRYHGVLFSSDGICLDEAASKYGGGSQCVKKYPVVARAGLIWVWLGDDAKAEENPVPDIDPAQGTDLVFKSGHTPVPQQAGTVKQALADLWATAGNDEGQDAWRDTAFVLGDGVVLESRPKARAATNRAADGRLTCLITPESTSSAHCFWGFAHADTASHLALHQEALLKAAEAAILTGDMDAPKREAGTGRKKPTAKNHKDADSAR